LPSLHLRFPFHYVGVGHNVCHARLWAGGGFNTSRHRTWGDRRKLEGLGGGDPEIDSASPLACLARAEGPSLQGGRSGRRKVVSGVEAGHPPSQGCIRKVDVCMVTACLCPASESRSPTVALAMHVHPRGRGSQEVYRLVPRPGVGTASTSATTNCCLSGSGRARAVAAGNHLRGYLEQRRLEMAQLFGVPSSAFPSHCLSGVDPAAFMPCSPQMAALRERLRWDETRLGISLPCARHPSANTSKLAIGIMGAIRDFRGRLLAIAGHRP